MNRRDTVLAILAVGALSHYSLAQQPDKVYRIAFASPLQAGVSDGPGIRAFVQGLRALGYVEGRNLVLDRKSIYGLDAAGIDDSMTEWLRLKPDVIVVPSITMAVSAANATSSVPIVMVASVDPVGAGLVHSLARPGGNVTGLAIDVGTGAEEKRLQLFLELLPNVRRIAFVGLKSDWENAWGKAIQSAAAKRRVDVFLAEGKLAGFGDALVALRQRKSEAFFVALAPRTLTFGPSFGEFTVANRIPSSCGITEMADQGCLMAYGQSVVDLYAHVVTYVDKILKGAKAGDLPIEQPTKFELVINLKTAKALGIKVPQSLLLRADRLIE